MIDNYKAVASETTKGLKISNNQCIYVCFFCDLTALQADVPEQRRQGVVGGASNFQRVTDIHFETGCVPLEGKCKLERSVQSQMTNNGERWIRNRYGQ